MTDNGNNTNPQRGNVAIQIGWNPNTGQFDINTAGSASIFEALGLLEHALELLRLGCRAERQVQVVPATALHAKPI